jgi:class 3 adenylate cyclase
MPGYRSLVQRVSLLILTSGLSFAADFSRETGSFVFQNYSFRDYKTPLSQNWAAVQDRRGVMWVANTDTLLEFDGVSWRKIPITGGSVPRSLGTDSSGTVYVGATGQFGFVKPDATGTPQFTSLLPKVPPEDRRFADVWRVLPTPSGVYFTSYARVFRLNPDGSVKVWRPRSNFGRVAFSVSGRLYVKTKEQGLMRMQGDELLPVPGAEILAKSAVEDAVPFQGGALIATADRLYRLSGSGLEPIATSADSYLAKNIVYSMCILPGDAIALGTRTGGLVLLSAAGEVDRIVTKADGLPDNFISSISTDRQGGVWLTSDSGITRFNPGLSQYDEREELEGNLRYSLRHKGVLYAGTTSGLFRLHTAEGATPHFERVDGIAETVNSLLSCGDDLLVAADHGVYQVSEKGVSHILETRQLLNDLSASLHSPDTIYAAGRNETFQLKKSGGVWQKSVEIPVAGQVFSTILDDEDGRVWATAPNNIWRLDFDQPSAKPEQFGAAQGVPAGPWITALRFDGHVVFATSKGLKRFSEQMKRFAPDQSLGPKFADGSRDVVNVFDGGAGNVWVTGEHEEGKSYHTLLMKDGAGWREHPAPLLRAGIDEIIWMSLDSDGTAWAAGAAGVLFRWQPGLAGNPDRDFTVLTRSVQVDRKLLYGGDGAPQALRLPYQSNGRLRFEFASPFFEEPGAVQYQVQLVGYDHKWTDWSTHPFNEYTGLSERSYRFRVRALSPHGAVAEESTFAFDVLPPWYRTWLAYAVYVVLGGFGVWGIVGLRTRQLEADKRQLEATVAERTVEIRQQRDEIQVQERKSHSLLLNILPAKVADELKATGAVQPVGFDDVTVCFTDFVGFTLSSEKMAPGRLVEALNEYFTAFDEIITRYGLEKLKTIGDSYMFVSGLPVRRASHAVDAVLAALEMAEVVKRLAAKPESTGWNIRIGLHSGPVVAGVVGIRKFAFDIWGNTVNFAARMESSGVHGRVNMSERTCRLTRELIVCESRGNVKIKEGRELPMFLAAGPAEDFASRYEREFGSSPAYLPAQGTPNGAVMAHG